MAAHSYVPNELLGRLIGSRLYSVNFVHDYVQLHFGRPSGDLPVLTCDALPTITIVDGTRSRKCTVLRTPLVCAG
ncbi:hypothetical protein [Amycolatopsis sp. lyj-84]|uniref:hypothetical protein n=1 Tax=Amycolatopsis sp. lyj-84 TaxID=2789284 RepID=UPI0039784A36